MSSDSTVTQCLACLWNPFLKLYRFPRQFNTQIMQRVEKISLLSERQRDLRLRESELHLDHLEEEYLCCICLKKGDYRDTDLSAVKESEEIEKKWLEQTIQFKAQQATKLVVLGTAKGIADVAKTSTHFVVDGVADVGKGVAKVTKTAAHDAGQEGGVGGIFTFAKKIVTFEGLWKDGTEQDGGATSADGKNRNREGSDGDEDNTQNITNAALDAQAEKHRARRQVRFQNSSTEEKVVLDARPKQTEAEVIMSEGGYTEDMDVETLKRIAKDKERERKERELTVKAVSSYHRDQGLVRIQGRAEEEMLSSFYQKPIRGFLCLECHSAAKFRRERLHDEIAEIIEKGRRPFIATSAVATNATTSDSLFGLRSPTVQSEKGPNDGLNNAAHHQVDGEAAVLSNSTIL
eukprot:PhF_6_TR19465/c0_g1_i1/m.28448